MNKKKKILNSIIELKETNKKGLAVLLDPDKVDFDTLADLVYSCEKNGVTHFFVGGSLITNHILAEVIQAIKAQSNIPIILFPGSNLHIENTADAILLLSLISGRNSEFLIGQHVISAPILRKSGLEILPTGYILVESGKQTTVSYISNTTPIPHDKPSIAACTAMAGEMLGLQLIYLDAGSGAQKPVSPEMIATVRQSVSCPIIVGGGIRNINALKDAYQAGADLVVIGNHIETNPNFLNEIGEYMNALKTDIVSI
jgi:phosphoglycerol geranylgeranyltransferase